MKTQLALLGLLFFFSSCSDMETDGTYSSKDSNSTQDVLIDNSQPELSEKVEDEAPLGAFENPFEKVAEDSLSTFSIDADGGSYANVRRYLNSNSYVPPYLVRTEEFLNYFPFDYPQPTGSEALALNSEYGPCPWNEAHTLLRLGIQGKALETIPPSNFVFLVDVSGSMNEESKLPLLQQSLLTLVDVLDPKDVVSIVTYAGASAILLEPTPASQATQIKNAIRGLTAGGGTAGAAGISTAYELAQQAFIEGGNNRILMGTDGDFNVGLSGVDELKELVKSKRDEGIYLTTLGFGYGNYNDEMMEQIANIGNGTYEYIDNSKQLEKVLVQEKSKLYTVAKDVKVQIAFDPQSVQEYRLIGYENRALADADFQKDTTDAGELGANQSVTALYEIIPVDTSSTMHLGSFAVRYKSPNGEEIHSLDYAIPSSEDPSESFYFAASVAGFSLLLKNSQYKEDLSFTMVQDLAEQGMSFDPSGLRAEFVQLVEKAAQSGNYNN